MDALIPGLGSIGGAFVAQLIPGFELMSPVNKALMSVATMTAGNFGIQLVRALPTVESLWKRWAPRPCSLYVEHDGPIYQRLETYIIHSFAKNVRTCQVEPRGGDISMTLNDARFHKNVVDTFEGHALEMHLIQGTDYSYLPYGLRSDLETNCGSTANHGTQDGAPKSSPSVRRVIVVSSWKLTVPQLQQYVTDLCQFQLDAKEIKMFIVKTIPGKQDKNDTFAWEQIRVKTNKRLCNTIVSDTVEKELVHDLQQFMNSEQWYNEKGIPWKRGYILYGKPGTGKTSMIKSIAAEYNMPVFVLDFSTVNTNKEFCTLMNKINHFSGNKPYILAFEDMDRSLFETGFYREQRVSFSCFLNEIDGLNETPGRLLFITGNDKSKFDDPEKLVLFRPGRVDVTVNIDHCDYNQLMKLLIHFYGEGHQEFWDSLTEDLLLKDMFTPATVINIIQKYVKHNEPRMSARHFFKIDVDDCPACEDLAPIPTEEDRKLSGLREQLRNIEELEKRFDSYSKSLKNYTKEVSSNMKRNQNQAKKRTSEYNKALKKKATLQKNVKDLELKKRKRLESSESRQAKRLCTNTS